MESLAQLNAAFWFLTFGSLFAFGWILTIVVLWKMFRAFRDLHSISESLHWIAHCTRSQDQIEQAKVMHVANSAFGR
jgi:hypothetical protein